jgi:hypothetical protein
MPVLSQSLKRIEQDTLKLSDSTDSISFPEIELEEVIVKKSLPFVIDKFDRKVYPMSESKKATARTVLDLLRTLPGIVVDEKENIRFKGTEASVYIDDQPMNKMYSRIEMIPVEKIDKIELIDPAMRTGGDGHGGIINVRLKIEKTDGLSGIASVNTGTTYFDNIDNSRYFFNLNYKKKNDLIFFLNSSIESSEQHLETDMTGKVNLPDFSSNQMSISQDSTKRTGFYNYLGATYDYSENTKLYLSIHFLQSTYRNHSGNHFLEQDENTGSVFNQYTENESMKEKQLNAGFHASYQHTLDTLDSYFKWSGGFYVFNGLSDRHSRFYFQNINSKMTDSLYIYDNERNFYSKALYLDFFLNKSITKTSRWNLAYNISVDNTDSLYNKHRISGKLYLPKNQMNQNKNQSHHLSFRIGTQINKWKLDGGVNFKAEHINAVFDRYKLDEQDTILSIKKLYFRILPSITIVYSFNDISEMKLSLSQTSEPPYFLQLSDFVDKNNLYNWVSGNPDLKPIDYYSIYWSCSHHKEKWNASAEVFFNYTDNEAEDLAIPINSLIALSKPENIARKSNTGLDLSFWYELNNKLNCSVSSSLFHTFFDLKNLSSIAKQLNINVPDMTKRQFGYHIKYSMEYKLRDFYTLFYINYFAKELTFDGYDKPSIHSSLSLGKRLLKNKLRATLSINNIFNSLFEHGSYSDNFGITRDTKLYGTRYDCNFYLSLQYSFNQGDRGTKDYK